MDNDVVTSLSREALETARIFANDFIRSGVRLPPHQRSQFVTLSSEILSLGRIFLLNTQAPRPIVKLSLSAIKGSNDWVDSHYPLDQSRKVVIQPNSAAGVSILRDAHNEDARRMIYLADQASSPEHLDILERLLKTRAKLANLVGYPSFAAMALEDKMAKTPGTI